MTMPATRIVSTSNTHVTARRRGRVQLALHDKFMLLEIWLFWRLQPNPPARRSTDAHHFFIHRPPQLLARNPHSAHKTAKQCNKGGANNSPQPKQLAIRQRRGNVCRPHVTPRGSLARMLIMAAGTFGRQGVESSYGCSEPRQVRTQPAPIGTWQTVVSEGANAAYYYQNHWPQTRAIYHGTCIS